jgi:hypothetical protein
MIGWWFLILAQTPEERASAVAADPRSPQAQAAILATWEINVAGIDWVNDLVGAGKAVEVLSGGYPSRYRAIAGDVLPLVSDGPPAADTGFAVVGDDYVMPRDWSSNVTIHRDRLAGCQASQALTIEVWDQS